ncbi:MAG TPA: polyprenyl synthetase family protein [Abditibacteriaceae bacterium]|nr:polyprenyl synthetase family protein [Abditibacteriaceae bacterium]
MRKTQSYTRYSNDPLLRSIWDYPGRLVAARGKRIRPYVAYLMYQSLSDGGEQEDEGALRLLVALELFHLFCLIHDDIIDKGAERYSLPTLHRYVAAELDKENRLSDHNCPNHAWRDHAHIGNAQAILLGDMLFAWSQEAFHANRDFSCGTLHEARGYFSSMIDEVVIGEMLDVDMTTRHMTSREAIYQKMLLKTASYTFIRPMQIGAALANRGEQCEAFCHDLGLSLGLAFQIQDDLLDIVGTSKSTRKSVFSDLREHQHTYFTQYILERGTTAQKSRLRELMGSDVQPEDRLEVIELFESSGALSYGMTSIRRHLSDAYHLLHNAPMRLHDRRPFYKLIETIQGRSL